MHVDDKRLEQFSMKEALVVREAKLADVPDIVGIHKRELPHSLLSRLGNFFLEYELYPTLLEERASAVFVVTENNIVIGFAIFGKNTSTISRIISAKKVAIIKSILKKIFVDPSLFMSCYRASKAESSFDGNEDSSHLAIIAVSSIKQSKGTGTFLLSNSVRKISSIWGVQKVAVETRTASAARFYKRNGFAKIGEVRRGTSIFQNFVYKIIP